MPAETTKDGQTKTTTYDSGGFTRTALVITPGPGGSVDLVDPDGNRLAQVNMFNIPGEDHLIVDVIDIDDRYSDKHAMTFNDGKRQVIPVNYLVSADYK